MTEKLRVYLTFDEANSSDVSHKIGRPTLRSKVILSTPEDQSGAMVILLSKFCDKYNAQTNLPEEYKLLKPDALQINPEGTSTILKPSQSPITNYISDYNDVHVIFAPPADAHVVQHEAGSVPCTNFGCGKRFVPGRDDGPESCNFHAGKPVFHDTYKYWSCCPQTKSMDFADFEAVATCAVGAHKHDPVTISVAVSGSGGSSSNPQELDRKPLTEEEIRALEGKNASPTSCSSAAAAAQASPLSSEASSASGTGAATRGPREFTNANANNTAPGKPVNAEGQYRCRNHGCQQLFLPAENNATACKYHSGGPVFHDTYKYWSCCKEKKCTEFDEFAKVVGCCVGEHLV